MEQQTSYAIRTRKRNRWRHLPRDDLFDKEMRGGNFGRQVRTRGFTLLFP